MAALLLSGCVIVALFAAFMMFGRGAADAFGGEGRGLQFVRRGIGFDDFYGFLARSVDLMGRLGARGADPFFQDGLPSFVGRSFHGLSYAMGEIQNGQTRFYMAILALFTAVFLLFSIVLHGGILR